jgi:hypothetical protein
MLNMTPEEEKRILESRPAGTWAVLAVYGALTVIAWLLLWYRFISFGHVS